MTAKEGFILSISFGASLEATEVTINKPTPAHSAAQSRGRILKRCCPLQGGVGYGASAARSNQPPLQKQQQQQKAIQLQDTSSNSSTISLKIKAL